MPTIVGRISRLLHNAAGEVHGFSLEIGLDVNFPFEYSDRILAIATVSARVAIQVRATMGPGGRHHSALIFLRNLDSLESIDLASLPTQDSPEVSTYVCAPPRRTPPPAPPLRATAGPFDSAPLERASPAASRIAIEEIERAYDQLHRTQAMLAYLQILKQEKTPIGPYFDEAKHTYVQALSKYDAEDFEEAHEFAAASNSLSQSIEILISRTFRSSAEYPRIVPPPPEEARKGAEDGAGRENLRRVVQMLVRIRWVIENGTLPSEDRRQVEEVASWAENLCRSAHRLLETHEGQESVKFTRAAEAAVSSAEHLCRRCYLTSPSGVRTVMAS